MTENNFSMAKMTKFLFDGVENIVGKGENPVTNIFLLEMPVTNIFLFSYIVFKRLLLHGH